MSFVFFLDVSEFSTASCVQGVRIFVDEITHVYRSEGFAMNTDTHTNGSKVKNHILIKNGIRIQCNTENFVPIVVPGLSSSSSSSSHSSTSMIISRQEKDHPTSSSSSSTSPPMTSSTVSSESFEQHTSHVTFSRTCMRTFLCHIDIGSSLACSAHFTPSHLHALMMWLF